MVRQELLQGARLLQGIMLRVLRIQQVVLRVFIPAWFFFFFYHDGVVDHMSL
jgi:hypothetical protein